MNGSHSGNFAVADWIWRPAPGLPDFGRRCYPAVANTMKNLLSQSGRSLGDEEILEILHALNGAGMDGTPLSLGIADTADLVHAKKIYTPDADNTKTYAQLVDISGRLYHNLQKEFAEIAAYQAGH